MHLQLDLPPFGESISFSDLTAFVRLAEAAGVAPNAAVELKSEPNTTDIPQCLEVVADEPDQVERSVPVGVTLLRWAVASIDAVTSGDGDARHMLTDLLQLRGDLMDALLDMSPADEDLDDGAGNSAHRRGNGRASRDHPFAGT